MTSTSFHIWILRQNISSNYNAGHASVTINGNCKSAIKEGLLVLVGIEEADGQEDIEWLCKKIVNLRIFDDENGVMNKSVLDVDGEILVISQFTLHGMDYLAEIYLNYKTIHIDELIGPKGKNQKNMVDACAGNPKLYGLP